MNSLREQLQLMQEQDLLKPNSVEAITHCLSGAMNEAVLWISDQLDQKEKNRRSDGCFTTFVGKFKKIMNRKKLMLDFALYIYMLCCERRH